MSDASVEANKALIMRFNEEVFNNHDLAAVDRFLSGDHFNHVTGTSGCR